VVRDVVIPPEVAQRTRLGGRAEDAGGVLNYPPFIDLATYRLRDSLYFPVRFPTSGRIPGPSLNPTLDHKLLASARMSGGSSPRRALAWRREFLRLPPF
jgi:hypothetical protein